jgi:hypothetical protein
MQTVDYSVLKPTLKTGDLLLFQGDDLLDWMIQLEGDSPFNHVGMVVTPAAGGLDFWDAPGGGEQFPDPLVNTGAHAGARGADLDTLLAYYMHPGVSLYCRQISPAPTAAEITALNIFIALADGTPFPGQDVKLPDEFGLGVGLALSYFIGNEFNMTISDNYFCAHLIAQTYMSMGYLPTQGKPANAYSPAAFGGSAGTTLPLIGHTLSDIVQVTYDATAAVNAYRAGV